MTEDERELFLVIRKTDEHFEKDGAASTKTWIREYFLPYLEEAGLKVVKAIEKDEPDREWECAKCNHWYSDDEADQLYQAKAANHRVCNQKYRCNGIVSRISPVAISDYDHTRK